MGLFVLVGLEANNEVRRGQQSSYNSLCVELHNIMFILYSDIAHFRASGAGIILVKNFEEPSFLLDSRFYVCGI